MGQFLKPFRLFMYVYLKLSPDMTAATAGARPSYYYYKAQGVDPGRFSWVRPVDLKTVCMVVVVIKQSLGSWSHMWSLSKVSGCGSTSLFLVLVQGLTKVRDQSRALEDRNDSNNSLEVYTPSSFIHLFYNSPYMDVVDMHNKLIIPSDSVLWEKTMEASYHVGSFPCQFDFNSVFDIPVRDGVWEQATFRHFCPFWQAAHSIYPLSPHQVMVGTLESRIRQIHLYLSQQIGVRSSKTSQCGSANRPSVVPQGSPRVLVPF